MGCTNSKRPHQKVFFLKNSMSTPQMTTKIRPIDYILFEIKALKKNSRIFSELPPSFIYGSTFLWFSRQFSVPQERGLAHTSRLLITPYSQLFICTLGNLENFWNRLELGIFAESSGKGLWEAESCTKKRWEGGSHIGNPISRRKREPAMAGKSVETIL